MKTQTTPWRAGIAALTAGLMAMVPAAAIAQENFYQGQTITILMGHPPGGSYDLYGQLAAVFLGRHIPGEPNVIVQHMPGGGGSLAVAHFANRAPDDGTVIGLFPETLAHTQLLEPETARWDVGEFQYIGSFAPVNPAFVVNSTSPAQSVEGLYEHETNVGCTGRTSQSYQMPAILRALAGMNLNLICGYEGSGAFTLALERGEVDMVSSAWNSWRSSHMEHINEGTMTVILQGGLTRMSELADVPLMQEVVDDPDVKAVLEFISAGAPIGRSLVGVPGTDPEVIEILRVAFDAMVLDPDFLAEAERRGALIEPMQGADVQQISDNLLLTSPEIIALTLEAQQ